MCSRLPNIIETYVGAMDSEQSTFIEVGGVEEEKIGESGRGASSSHMPSQAAEVAPYMADEVTRELLDIFFDKPKDKSKGHLELRNILI